MATVTEKKRNGKVFAFKFFHCVGRDEKGKQHFRTTTWKPPENLSYVSFNEKLDEFQKSRSSWEIDFEFIYDKNADEFDYVYEIRTEELVERKQAIYSRALALEESSNYEEAFDLYWMARDLSEAEDGLARCHAKFNEAYS